MTNAGVLAERTANATRWLLAALLAAGAAGCDFLAPVVSTFPASGRFNSTCEPPPSCEGLDAPPPPPARLAELRGPDGACGTNGRVPRTMEVVEDTSIDANELGCVDLTVEIEGAGSGVRVLRLRGEALTRARVHVRSQALPVLLQIEVSRIEESELRVDGPIDVTLGQVQADASRIVLEAVPPLRRRSSSSRRARCPTWSSSVSAPPFGCEVRSCAVRSSPWARS